MFTLSAIREDFLVMFSNLLDLRNYLGEKMEQIFLTCRNLEEPPKCGPGVVSHVQGINKGRYYPKLFHYGRSWCGDGSWQMVTQFSWTYTYHMVITHKLELLHLNVPNKIQMGWNPRVSQAESLPGYSGEYVIAFHRLQLSSLRCLASSLILAPQMYNIFQLHSFSFLFLILATFVISLRPPG